MHDQGREFEASDVDGAAEYARHLASSGATTAWLEAWDGRGWQLAYGSDPASVERHLRSTWDARGRFRIRVPDDVREPPTGSG